MAFCPTCGKQNMEGAIFCEACGTLMTGSPAAHAVPAEPEAISRLRSIGSSSTFLALAILETAAVALSLFFNGSFDLFGILTLISLWLIYATAKKPTGSLVNTSGVSILRTLAIIEMVCVIIGLVCICLCLLVFGILQTNPEALGEIDSEFPFFSSMVPFCLILFSACLVVLVLALLQAIFASRYYGSLRATLQTGFPSLRSAKAFGVITLISGVFSFLETLLQFIFQDTIQNWAASFLQMLSQYGITDLDIELHAGASVSQAVSLFASLLSFATIILAFLLVLRSKKELDSVAAPIPAAPVYAQPPQNNGQI